MVLSRHRPDLEEYIPNHLKDLPRVCSREECGSQNVELRYFNNKEKVGYVQPRFFCNDCKKLFTLGGKLRKKYKKPYKKTKKIRIDEKTRNLQIQHVEIGESSRPTRLGLARKHSSKQSRGHVLSLETKGTPSKIHPQEDNDVIQETNMVEENLELFDSNELDETNCSREEADCNSEEDDCNSEEDDCNSEEDDYGFEEAVSDGDQRESLEDVVKAHSPSVQNTILDTSVGKDHQPKRPRDQTEVGLDKNEGDSIQMDLLKNEIKRHLLNAQLVFYDFQVKKEATNIGRSCKRIIDESKRLRSMSKRGKDALDEGIEGLMNNFTKMVGGLVDVSEHDRLIQHGATMEEVFPIIETMLVEVEEMDLESVSYSDMLARLERAKQLRDQVSLSNRVSNL